MRDVLPSDRVASGIALMSSSLGVGGAVGLPLTGLVAQQASWRWLFAGAAVLGAIQCVLVRVVVQESPLRSGGRFDLLGALGLGAALVCLLLAISKGSEWGWLGPPVLGLLAAAVRAVRPVGAPRAAGPHAAGRPAGVGPAHRALDEHRLHRDRLRDVRGLPRDHADPAGPPGDGVRLRTVAGHRRAGAPADRRGDVGLLAGVGAHLPPPRGAHHDRAGHVRARAGQPPDGDAAPVRPHWSSPQPPSRRSGRRWPTPRSPC